MNQKSKLVTFLLCWLLGPLGIHRFYTGKIWTGLLYLLTGGLWGIGVVVDMICLLLNTYKSKENGQEILLKNDLPTSIIILLFILWVIILILLWVFGILGSVVGGIFGLLTGLFV